MKKTLIIQEAQEIRKYIETNRSIPKTNNINGTIYSIYQTSYLLAKMIRNNFKQNEYTPNTNIITYNTLTHKDTINEKVLKDDYLQMISNFLNYCINHRRVPTYITTQKTRTKVSFELFVYCLSKIVVFFNENGTFPSYCIFNKADLQNTKKDKETNKNNVNQSTSTCTNPYNPNKGCDAMGQNTSYYCGVSALQKCLYKLGVRNVTQKELASVCGTTTAGTSHNGIRTGVAWASKKYNVKLTVEEHYFSDYTIKQLHDTICNKNKAIICHNLYRNKYGHYEAWKSVNEKTGDIEVINSLGDKCTNTCYCGYIEKRSYTTQKSYCNGISQKSLIIIKKE